MQYEEDIHRANPDWYHLLKENAKRMRLNPTEAEAYLWQFLKGKQQGVSFKRQCVILDFIADFYAPEVQLIVEIDGEYHNEEGQVELDAYRTERLERKGYSILRFSNDEVFNDTEYVINSIRSFADLENIDV